MNIDGAERDATRLGIREVVRNNGLGATLVAALAGSRDPLVSHRWARTDGSEPGAEAQVRLQLAHRVWTAAFQRGG